MKIFLFFVILVNLQCSKHCDIYTYKKLTGTMEDYFGAYKEKNWWVYQNSTGTKRDSIFLSDYKDIFLGEENKKVCEKNEQRTFTINSLYLVDGEKPNPEYFSLGNASIFNFRYHSLPTFSYTFTDQKIIVSPSQFNTGTPYLDSININGTKYYNILVGKESTSTCFFAKGIGLVGWMNVLDTFNLVNFKIF